MLYSLDVSHVSAGDILLVTGEGQLTRVGNETKTLLSAELKLCNSTTDIVCSGGALDEGNGINIKDDLAIGLPVKLSIKPFPTAPNSAYHYVNLLVHSNGCGFQRGSRPSPGPSGFRHDALRNDRRGDAMNRTARRLVPMLVAACACLAGPAGALTFHTYKTAVGGELISTLPGDNTNRVLYSLPISTISAGDVLVVDNESKWRMTGSSPPCSRRM